MIHCRACGRSELVEILDLGLMPSVGGFLPSKSSFSDDQLYPLKVYVCDNCSLVQIIDPIDPDILFKNYSFSSSTVGPLVDHFEEYASWLKNSLGATKVFEFGCNDGILLKKLNEKKVDSVGIDISQNITEAARSEGLRVITGYFNEKNACEVLKEYGHFGVVTGSNAFAHNDKPEKILEAARILLNDNGSLCLEVMYAGDLLEKFQWDTLYHEHLTFYSLGTLEVLLSRYGFYIYDAVKIPMHGGSLRIAAGRDVSKSKTASYFAVKNYEDSIMLNDPSTWHDFGKITAKKIEIVKNVFGSLSSKYTVAAYGAAGKAAMWFNSSSMTYLKYVVDESPLRAGKFMPGTHTPIVYPSFFAENPVDYVFISAWNYAPVITKKESWYKGIWAVPLPNLSFY